MTATTASTTLLLDPDIRDWVVLPLFFIMILAGLLRQNIGQMLQSAPTKSKVLPQRVGNLMKQSFRLRSAAAHYLTTYEWQVRKQAQVKLLQQEAEWCLEQHQSKQESEGTEDDDPLSSMMSNPLSMMKGNFAFMAQNMIMMQGIQHFFSGFVLLKVPFPLTKGFKDMFQRGLVELPDLDSSYVSSLSWYFLVMYGLRGFFKLIIGEPSLEVKEQAAMHNQFGLGHETKPTMPGQGGGQDGEAMAQQLKKEAENLEVILMDHKSELDQVEKRLLGAAYPKKNKRLDQPGVDFMMSDTKKSKKSSQKKKVT